VRPLLLLAMSDFLEPGGGPEQSGDFRIEPSFFIVLFAIGFCVGVVGHLARSRTLIAVGVLLVMLATVFLPLALAVSR
jgi:hypothetical protein